MPWTHQARSELSSPALRGLLEVLLVLLLQEALFHPAHRQLKLTAVVFSILFWRMCTNLRSLWAVGSNDLSSLQKYNSLWYQVYIWSPILPTIIYLKPDQNRIFLNTIMMVTWKQYILIHTQRCKRNAASCKMLLLFLYSHSACF